MKKTAAEIHGVIGALLQRHLIDPAQPSYYTWERSDRVIVSVNPANIRRLESVTGDSFMHSIKTNLGGVPVVKTNSRGVYFQIGYSPAPPVKLESKTLDLANQPGPLDLPMGQTKRGPLWLSISALGSILVGGTRRMGKTRLVHAWIQALINGDTADLWIRDGKNGTEFRRYAVSPRVTHIEDLQGSLTKLQELAGTRDKLYDLVSATSLPEYNSRVPAAQRLAPVILIIDEASILTVEEVESLTKIIAWGGAYGIHPIVIMQRTGSDDIPPAIKTNLATRICFPVPATSDSMTVLGRSGAQELPKIPGRYCFEWEGRMVECQAYRVDLPGVPLLSPADIEIAQRAITEKRGRLSIPILIEWGYTERDARAMLDEWQSRGWLDGGGQGVARRVSARMEELICQSVKVASKCQSDGQSCQSSGPGSDSAAWEPA